MKMRFVTIKVWFRDVRGCGSVRVDEVGQENRQAEVSKMPVTWAGGEKNWMQCGPAVHRSQVPFGPTIAGNGQQRLAATTAASAETHVIDYSLECESPMEQDSSNDG